MVKKMHVAILIDSWLPFFGGAQKQVQETTKIFKKAFKIKVFHGFSQNFFLRIFWSFYVIPQVLFHHFFKEKFTLLHAHAFLAGLPAKLLATVLRIPIVFTIHGSGIGVWYKMEPGVIGRIKKRLENFILFKIKYDAQISVSSDIKGYKNVNSNIFFIPNAVDTESYDKIKIKKDSAFKILFVGRLHIQKGLPYLIKAVSVLVGKYPNISLHLVGEGPQKKFLEKMVKNLKLERYIHFMGFVSGDKLIKEYKSSQLFVLPSFYEGQPLTLLEAWAAKIPVVATAVGENSKMVKNGFNGYLVNNLNSPELSKAIRKAIENPNLERMGQNGYLLVKKNYTWSLVSKKIYRVYQKVLKLC